MSSIFWGFFVTFCHFLSLFSHFLVAVWSLFGRTKMPTSAVCLQHHEDNVWFVCLFVFQVTKVKVALNSSMVVAATGSRLTSVFSSLPWPSLLQCPLYTSTFGLLWIRTERNWLLKNTQLSLLCNRLNRFLLFQTNYLWQPFNPSYPWEAL